MKVFYKKQDFENEVCMNNLIKQSIDPHNQKLSTYISSNKCSLEHLGNQCEGILEKVRSYNEEVDHSHTMNYMVFPNDGMSLQTWLRVNGNASESKIPFLRKTLISSMYQVCLTSSEMLDNGIFHGDIKESNILVSKQKDGSIKTKLCDFGLSDKISKYIPHVAHCARYEYYPPEAIGFRYGRILYTHDLPTGSKIYRAKMKTTEPPKEEEVLNLLASSDAAVNAYKKNSNTRRIVVEKGEVYSLGVSMKRNINWYPKLFFPELTNILSDMTDIDWRKRPTFTEVAEKLITISLPDDSSMGIEALQL